MKKLYLLLLITSLIINYLNLISKEIDIGPVEFKENVNSICKKTCSEKKLNWTGKTFCDFQTLSEQNICRCQCNGR